MNLEEFAKLEIGGDRSGHSLQHAKRVEKLTKEIAEKEGGNLRVCLAAALLHDCADEFLFKDVEAQNNKISANLVQNGYSKEEIAEIMDIIATISFHKEKSKPLTKINAQIVSDADKLEAIGAIGLVRTIEYGASRGRPFYEERNLEDVDGQLQFKEATETTLSHFYEKLLRLGSHFYTDTAKKMAEPRLAFLRAFLAEFYRELDE